MSIFDYARREIEKTYDCTFKAIGFHKYKNPETNVTTTTNDHVFIDSAPCRMSTRGKSVAHDGVTEGVPTSIYELKLFCSPDLLFPAGCRLEVTHPNGSVTTYKHSGQKTSGYYPTHAEYVVQGGGFI